ncbi:MAG: hypothetical protein GXP14_17530 [Gammaproteobacteria bacterium]|nr:hypothetical protein [Gammaproteobacteria bacterium]
MKQLKIQKKIEFKLRMLATPELEEKIKNNKYFTKKVEELNAKVEKAQSLSDKSRFSIDCY